MLVALAACARSEPSAPAPDPGGSPESAVAPEPAPAPMAQAAPSGPVVTEEATRAHAAAATALGDGPLAGDPLVHHRSIERAASGPSPLAHFHAALRALKRGEDPDGKVRVAVYGASSTSADRYTAYLRRYLQARFGDGGPGFVALVPLWRWHRHDLVHVEASKHWAIEHAQKKKGRLDGRYGLLGASAYSANKRARASLRPKDSALRIASLELWYLAQPEGGAFDVQVAGTAHRVQTAADAPSPGYFPVQLPGPVSPALKIAPGGDGEVRLFGATMETEGPGVVVDNLGIGGTRAANHLDWDETLWRDGIRRRKPDLYMLAYGANESIDEDEPIEQYRSALEAVLGRFRQALPQGSCVLIGPQDYPMQDEAAGKDAPWLPRPRLAAIVEIQRDVALAAGCGFFDLRELMGGEGAMEAWVAADPPLGKADHLHLTPLGYLHVGKVLSDALMAEYDATDG